MKYKLIKPKILFQFINLEWRKNMFFQFYRLKILQINLKFDIINNIQLC